MKKLENEIKILFQKYDKLYKPEGIKNTDIETYGENEFFGGKREAFQDVLELFEKR